MGDDSLLDQMLADHVERAAEAPKRQARTHSMAGALDDARRASRRQEREEELKAAEARTRARTRAAELAGFREGTRFEIKGQRPELRGDWVVVRVDPGAAGDASRRLYAQRASGAEGYLPLTEKQLQDLLYARLVVRQD